MSKGMKYSRFITRLRKTAWYSRIRQHLPMRRPAYVNDRDKINDAEIVKIDWPDQVKKPLIGIVQDNETFPRWTKYCRFLDNNLFNYVLYDLHAHDWIEKAEKLDIIIGISSSEVWDLDEFRRKYYFLEKFQGKTCYPSAEHVNLYEDKMLEAYLARVYGFPFANTYISHNEADALAITENLNYPSISKISPASGSVGVELVHSQKEARKIVNRAFSAVGRNTFTAHFRQKNYIYFQDFIPNDGYDIRVIVAGNWLFGYYRKVLAGDFRASGMNLVEKRELPETALRIAYQVNKVVNSPMLVVDMVHGLDDKYYIIEFSPICQMEFPEQLHVNGVPGVYVFDSDDAYHFEKGRYWVHELALKEFLINHYLPKFCNNTTAIDQTLLLSNPTSTNELSHIVSLGDSLISSQSDAYQ